MLKMKCVVLTLMMVFLTAVRCTSLFANEVLLPLKTSTPPVIDGKLDDPVWQNAPHVTGFKTFIPDYGIEMVDQTIVYYAYDRENLYFAYRCFDSQPDKIKTSVTRRDNIRPDDWVCINLDSFNDQQALYGFYINPAGIQEDSRFASGREDSGVDLVWYSAGQIDSAGYTLEVRIPFKSIRFANKEPVEMGVIFERRVSRRSEQGTYPPLSPERGFFFLTQMKPMLLHDIEHYTLFELLPAVTHSQRSALQEGRLASQGTDNEGSLTTKYGLTSDFILDGTYNPDFSQVESDAGQVDINQRFALFFSEKRPFFLEGSENFNFAGSSSNDPLAAIVHTRTIVDPIAGLKLSGKIGKKNFLATINAWDELPAREGEAIGQGKYAQFNVLRYKRALSGDNYIGAIYTGRERKKSFNRVLGLDGQLRINESSILGYHAFTSQSQDRVLSLSPDNKEHALGIDYLYNTRNLDVNLGFQDLSTNFNSETGYVTRTGISRIRAAVTPKFYPNGKVVRRIDPGLYSSQIKDKPSDLYETDNELSIRFLLHRNTNITLSYNYSTEVFLAEKFKTSGFNVSGSSQFTKQLFFRLSYRYGKAIRFISDTYQGKGSNASATVTYQPSEKLNANVSLNYSDLYGDSDAQKKFDVTIIRARVTYQLNRYLFFRGIVEKTSREVVEFNSLRKNVLADFLASFTYIPGTVIHVGYGSLYERKVEAGIAVNGDRFRETNRGFFFKTSYLWRL